MNETLKSLHDRFYTPLPLAEYEQEVETCHHQLIERLEKPERKLVLLTGLEPTRRIDTSTSSWPVYQFQHSRKQIPPKKDCLIIIAIRIHNVNQNLRFF